MPRQGAVCLSLRGTSATPPGRGGQVLGNNEASHDAGTVRLLYEETWQAPRPRGHRYRPSGYSRYPCRDFILTADFVNEIRVRLAGTVSVRCSSREIKGEAFEDRRAVNRCTNLSPPSSTKMLASHVRTAESSRGLCCQPCVRVVATAISIHVRAAAKRCRDKNMRKSPEIFSGARDVAAACALNSIPICGARITF